MRLRDAARAAFAALTSRGLPDGSTFLRGLSIGVLAGAAVAGSTIWQRRRVRGRIRRDLVAGSER